MSGSSQTSCVAPQLPSVPKEGIAQTYREIVAALPDSLRQDARCVLKTLGVGRPNEGGWTDFCTQLPLQDLPLVLSADPVSVRSREQLDAFRRAHHCAGFYGLLVDRIADRQVVPSRALRRLVRHLHRAWCERLGAAVGDELRARRAITRCLRTWRAAIREEHTRLALGKVSLDAYRSIVCRKVSWLGLAGRFLIENSGCAERTAAFQRAFERMLLGIQLMDDALDEREDRALHGSGVPQALGYPAAGLVRAAPKLLGSAARSADEAGLHRWADWLRRLGGAWQDVPIQIPALQAELAAQVIHASFLSPDSAAYSLCCN